MSLKVASGSSRWSSYCIDFPWSENIRYCRYKNNRLVKYNFDCGSDRLAYLSITDIHLEGKICEDPNLNNAEV